MTSSSCCSLSCKRSPQACTMECPTTVGTSPWRRNLSCCTGWSNGEIFATAFWKKATWKEFGLSSHWEIQNTEIRVFPPNSSLSKQNSAVPNLVGMPVWDLRHRIPTRRFWKPWQFTLKPSTHDLQNCTLRLLASRFSNYIVSSLHNWRPKQQLLWAWVTLNQKSVLMKKYAIHTSIDFVCQFEKDWSSWSNLHLSWKTLKQKSWELPLTA